MKKVKLVALDMDNTVVLSEEKAFEACTVVVNETLAAKGVDFAFTPAQLMERFVGKVFWRIISELALEHEFRLEPAELDTLTLKEQNAVIARLRAEVEPCEGVDEVLRVLYQKYILAVVSSSAMPRLMACLEKTGHGAFIPDTHVFSAATSLPVPTTKPEPLIYQHAMETLGVTADETVAVEDSKNGVLSAVRAGIWCVGYVGAYPEHERAELTKTLLEAGASIVITHWNEFEKALASREC